MNKKKLEVVLAPAEGGKTSATVKFRKIHFSDGNLDNEDLLECVVLLGPEATAPRTKVAAAAHFLKKAVDYQSNEPATLAYVDAFVQAARSATFALQKACAGSQGFREWYQGKRDEMSASPELKAIVELRNASQKEGLTLRYETAAEVRFWLNGKVDATETPPTIAIDGHPFTNPFEAFRRCLESIRAVVEEAHALGYVPVEPTRQQQFGIQYMRERSDGRFEAFDPGTPRAPAGPFWIEK